MHGVLGCGFDKDGEARIIEIPNHQFFMATLFLPQVSSKPGMPHPLVLSFLKAAESYGEL